MHCATLAYIHLNLLAQSQQAGCERVPMSLLRHALLTVIRPFGVHCQMISV